MIRSSIDLGTNTCLLLVVDCDDQTGAVKRVLFDSATIVRLGQGVDQDRVFHPEAMTRTLDCLKIYSEKLKALRGSPSETVAVATSQARDVKNASEFFEKIEKETGFRFRVISGFEEAQASFLGALLPSMSPRETVVIDIGGGSTELMSALSGQSMDMGSVRFTERHLKTNPVTDAEFLACQAAIDQNLEPLKAWRKLLPENAALLGVAGTVTTLATWFLGLPQFEASRIDGLELLRGDIHRMVEELKWRTFEERCKLPGIEAARADVLLAGALILWRSMEVLQFTIIKVSTRGLRYGVLKSTINERRVAMSENKRTMITMKTTLGDIQIELLDDESPKTVQNFLGLATGSKAFKDPKSGELIEGTPFYNGTIFHRVIPQFMVQGGDPTGTGMGGPGYRFEDEFHPSHQFNRAGLLAMANAGPGTNGSQFFITAVPTPHLNRKHTIFGEVKAGMEVVEKILATPRGAQDRPKTPISIQAIEVNTH